MFHAKSTATCARGRTLRLFMNFPVSFLPAPRKLYALSTFALEDVRPLKPKMLRPSKRLCGRTFWILNCSASAHTSGLREIVTKTKAKRMGKIFSRNSMETRLVNFVNNFVNNEKMCGKPRTRSLGEFPTKTKTKRIDKIFSQNSMETKLMKFFNNFQARRPKIWPWGQKPPRKSVKLDPRKILRGDIGSATNWM